MNMQDLAPLTASAMIILMSVYGLFVMFPALFSAFMVWYMPLVVLIIGCCGAWHYIFSQEDYGDTKHYMELLPKPIAQDIPQPPIPQPQEEQEVVPALQEEHEAPREQGEHRGYHAPEEKKTIINISDSVVLRNKFFGEEDE